LPGTGLRVYFPDGQSDGLRVVNKDNWDGVLTVCPKNLLENHGNRRELQCPGVYVLRGLDEAYIGEGDPVWNRIIRHVDGKEFWSRVYCFTSERLSKAHIQYLESRMIKLTMDSGACILTNEQQPMLPSLTESDISMCEGFLEQIMFLLKSLDVYILEKPRTDLVVKESLKIEQPPDYHPVLNNVSGKSSPPIILEQPTFSHKLELSNIKLAVLPPSIIDLGRHKDPRKFGNT